MMCQLVHQFPLAAKNQVTFCAGFLSTCLLRLWASVSFLIVLNCAIGKNICKCVSGWLRKLPNLRDMDGVENGEWLSRISMGFISKTHFKLSQKTDSLG